MLGLPKSTEFNRRIPKQKFYENLEITPTLRKIFVEQVKAIYWRNKIATSTTNLAPGTEVMELEVFEVKLHHPMPDDSLLRQIDRGIPYHILFLLEYDGNYQAWIGYKEAAASGNKAFNVNGYYHTDWLAEKDLPLHLEGLNLDKVYENFVRQVAGGKLQTDDAEESLKDSVERDEQRQLLQKEFDSLETKIRREKQLNRKMEMNARMKALRKKMEEL